MSSGTSASSGLDAAFEEIVVGAAPDRRPFCAELRARAPVYRTPFDFWYVTRYDLANAIMRSEGDWSAAASSASSARPRHDGFAFEVMGRMLLNMDGVDHTRLRRLVSTIFTGRAADRLRGRVEASVERQLDAVLGWSHVDLFTDVAQMLPTLVILDVLGIGHDHASTAIAVADSLIAMHEPTAGAESFAEANRAFAAAADVVVMLAADRRAEPRDDLLTALEQAADGTDRLTDDELVAMVIVLVVAGHETTANTLCTGVMHLLEQPDQLDQLRHDPSLIPKAVEELLRFDAATRNSVARCAVEDIEVGGQLVGKGTRCSCRSMPRTTIPAEFVDPLRLDLTRTPNRHIGFGGGAHYCLVAAVARMEHVAIGALLARTEATSAPARPSSDARSSSVGSSRSRSR